MAKCLGIRYVALCNNSLHLMLKSWLQNLRVNFVLNIKSKFGPDPF